MFQYYIIKFYNTKILRLGLNKFFFFLNLFYLKNLDLKIIDYFCVDYIGKKLRFSLNIQYRYFLINTKIAERSDFFSICSLFSRCNWLEREIYDLFGIFFLYHPNLQRLLTNYGFQGHPLRKDFPLTGFVEIRFDDIEHLIYTQPVVLTQMYRNFYFYKSW